MGEEAAAAPAPPEAETRRTLPTTGRLLFALPMVAFAAGIFVTYLGVWPFGLRTGVIAAAILAAAALQVLGTLGADRLPVLVGSLALIGLAYLFMGNLHPVLLGAGLYGLIVAGIVWLFDIYPKQAPRE